MKSKYVTVSRRIEKKVAKIAAKKKVIDRSYEAENLYTKIRLIEDKVMREGIGSDYALNNRARHAGLIKKFETLTGKRWIP